MTCGQRMGIATTVLCVGFALVSPAAAQSAPNPLKAIEHAETLDEAITQLYGDTSWIQVVQDLVKLPPKTRESYRWKVAYGLAYLKGERDAKVLQSWPALIEERPNDVGLWLSLAMAQLRAGKTVEAGESLAKVAAQASTDETVAYAMAVVEALKGDWTAAERQFDSLAKQGGPLAKEAEKRVLEIEAHRKHVVPARKKITDAVTKAEAALAKTDKQIEETKVEGRKAAAALAALKEQYDSARKSVYDRYREEVRDADRQLSRDMQRIRLQKLSTKAYATQAAIARRDYMEATRDARDARDDGYESVDSEFGEEVKTQRAAVAELETKFKSLRNDQARQQAERDRAIHNRNRAGSPTPFDAVKVSREISLTLCRPLLTSTPTSAPASAPAGT